MLLRSASPASSPPVPAKTSLLFYSSSLLLSNNCAPLKALAGKRRSLSVRCRRSDYFENQRFSSQQPPPPPSPPSTPEDFYSSTPSASQSPGAQSSRVFVGHSIYKGKAALTVEPRAPEFAPLDSGAYKVSKEGFVLLQFAPAMSARQYDWSRKQVFSLSVAEIGQLMCLGPKDSCEFFHDPYKGKSDEGKIRKVLRVEPLPDGTGHFFNLSVQNRLLNVDESIYIPITKAEFTVLISAFNFILPYLLGWHAFASAIKAEESLRSRAGAELEWNR